MVELTLRDGFAQLEGVRVALPSVRGGQGVHAEALAALLAGSIEERLSQLRVSRGLPVLGLHTDEVMERLPWELLASLPDHPCHDSCVVRLVDPVEATWSRPRIHRWEPSPQRTSPCELKADVLAAPGPSSSCRLLHVRVPTRELPAALERVAVCAQDVVFLDPQGEGPVSRGSGGIGWLAPVSGWDRDRSAAASLAVYEAASEGPVAMLRAARRAVGEGLRLWLSVPELGRQDALWTRAEELGRPLGYLGVEHLLLALCERPGGPWEAWLRVARPALDRVAREQPELVGPWSGPTPRARALQGLPGALLRVPWLARRLDPGLLGQLAEHGLHAPSSWEELPSGPGMLLEVWGGPEDGRRLTLLHRHQHLGRWQAGNEGEGPRLYGPDMAEDSSVSRQHLQYLGPGRLLILAPTRRDGQLLRGEVLVRPGDLLTLGERTRLEVLRPG